MVAVVVILATAGLLGAVPGCAFIFSEGPPAPERQAAVTYFDCSHSHVPPIIDTLLTGLAGLNGAAMVSAGHSSSGRSNAGAVALDAGYTALFGASAIYGYTVVSRCNGATQARLERALTARLLPPPYGLPPWGEPPPFWPPPLPPPDRAAVLSKPAPSTPTPTPAPTPTETPAPAAAPTFKPAPPAAPSAAPGD